MTATILWIIIEFAGILLVISNLLGLWDMPRQSNYFRPREIARYKDENDNEVVEVLAYSANDLRGYVDGIAAPGGWTIVMERQYDYYWKIYFERWQI